jgi:hypothetical protein
MFHQNIDLKGMLPVVALLLILPCSLIAQVDDGAKLATLTEALELTDEQVPQVEAIIGKFAADMDAAAAAAFSVVDEPDNKAILGAAKKPVANLNLG